LFLKLFHLRGDGKFVGECIGFVLKFLDGWTAVWCPFQTLNCWS